MRNKNIVWKVVRVDTDNILVSSSINYNLVVYKVGHKTLPPKNANQFLFVFKTRNQARIFKNHLTVHWYRKCYRIYKARAVEPRTSARNKYGNLIHSSHYEQYFNGVLFASAVTLLKKA